MLKTKDILYENGLFWILKKEQGHFEIYENARTGGYSTRREIVAYPRYPEKAWQRVITRCDTLARQERMAESVASIIVNAEE